MTVKTDSNGNRIVVADSGVVMLHLSGSKKPRNIGMIDRKTRIVQMKRTMDEHLMRKNNSYGFNHFLLSNAKTFDSVSLEDDYGSYLIPIKFILEYGSFLHFKEKGFETQIFLNINYLRKFENKIHAI